MMAVVGAPRDLKLFLKHLDSDLYRTDFRVEGSCNLYLYLNLRSHQPRTAEHYHGDAAKNEVGFSRRSITARRQPAAAARACAKLLGPDAWKAYPQADHVHFYGFYIGNYPSLEPERVLRLCELLNSLAVGVGGF